MSETDFSSRSVQALRWSDAGLEVLDQRALPARIVYEIFDGAQGVAEAIRTMRVRGAPAIGIAAAYGVALAARRRGQERGSAWKEAMEEDFALLAASRPTAVNLFWALERMKGAVARCKEDAPEDLLDEALAIHREDIAANRRMGELGASLLQGAEGVLTHCNTGALATGGHGTALGVIRDAWRAGGLRRVYACETRPWLQGARLTAWELSQERIPVKLIADSAAAWLMRTGAVQWVIVGADRIAANGDAANKIGTYSHAVNAKRHGVKFMVVAPTSTIDWQLPDGAGIAIEERDGRELLGDYYGDEQNFVGAWNPVFDVTPAELIDAIVTENGVALCPNVENMRNLRR